MYGPSTVFIKVKRLNTNSDYSVTVSTSNVNTSTEFLWELMVGIGVIIFVFAIVGTIVTVVLVVVYKRKNISKNKELPQNKERKNKYIENTLATMKSGLFRHWNPRHRQDSCVIWFQEFEDENQVYVTKEWNHLFHSNWLKTWYLSTTSNKLLCPHCQTENTPNSQMQEVNVFTLEGLASQN